MEFLTKESFSLGPTEPITKIDNLCYREYNHGMNVSLTPDLEKFVHDRLKSGLYGSASEVIREGLRLLADQEKLKQERITAFKREVARGLASARDGKLVDGEKAVAEILEGLNKRRKKTP